MCYCVFNFIRWQVQEEGEGARGGYDIYDKLWKENGEMLQILELIDAWHPATGLGIPFWKWDKESPW